LNKKERKDWKGKLQENEEKIIIKYILTLHKIIKEFSDDKNIEHNLILDVRNITATIGRRKNLKISLEAEKILGKNIGFNGIERARKENKGLTIAEHKSTVNDLYNELKSKKFFSEEDAKIWFNKAIIAIITIEENNKLKEKKWEKTRPDDAYEQLGIIVNDVWN